MERRFKHQLVGSVQSFIDAVRRIITTASYVILVAMATSFSLRVTALLVARRLAFTAARPQRSEVELRQQSVPRDDDVIGNVSDDENSDVSCHYDVTDAHPSTLVTARQSGILHNLKYYETNV